MAEYKPILMVAGVVESAATILEKKYEEKIPESFFLDALKYLTKIRPTILEMKRIYELCPPRFWTGMKVLGITNHREQILYRKQASLLQRTWSLRPILLKRKQVPLPKPKKDEDVE
jgi:hypothetical protein